MILVTWEAEGGEDPGSRPAWAKNPKFSRLLLNGKKLGMVECAPH
jgi:hypothetical protein